MAGERRPYLLYLVALLLPPLGALLCGKPFQAAANLGLFIVGVILIFGIVTAPLGGAVVAATVLHAFMVAHNFYADERQQRHERFLTALFQPEAAPDAEYVTEDDSSQPERRSTRQRWAERSTGAPDV